MEFKLDINEKVINELMNKSISNSDIFEEMITECLDNDEVKQIIKNGVIKFLYSPDGIAKINEAITNYIDGYDITDDSDIIEIIDNSIKKIIKNKFNI